MMLAVVLANHGDELRADFQQYYNLNIDGMGADYSVRHAAALCAQLPAGSRVMGSIDPRRAWTESDWLMSRIEFWAHVAAWQRTEDGEKGANVPKQIIPGDAGAGQEHRDEVLPVTRDELARIFKHEGGR